MESRTTLPLDILTYIIDLLAHGDDEDTKSLQILSRACKSLVPLCRKHLFSSLRLYSKLHKERISDLLSRNPDLTRYVKSLKYGVDIPISDDELRILDLIKARAILQSFEVISPPGFDWNAIPEPVESSLRSVIQLPTVTKLDIRSFKNFPSTALSLCCNLLDLRLEGLEMTPPEVNQVISRSKTPTPVSLYAKTRTYEGLATLMKSVSAGVPFVDFSRLQTASFHVDSPGDISRISDLIKTTTQLHSLYIDLAWPVELTGLGASFVANTRQTLKSVALKITVVGEDYDPLCGLSRELRFIVGNNILEEFELDIVVQTDAECRTESEDWAALDSLLTVSGAFPMLQRVSVAIWWFSFRREEDEVEDILESLTKEQFPRLVESRTVGFDFSAEHQYT